MSRSSLLRSSLRVMLVQSKSNRSDRASRLANRTDRMSPATYRSFTRFLRRRVISSEASPTARQRQGLARSAVLLAVGRVASIYPGLRCLSRKTLKGRGLSAGFPVRPVGREEKGPQPAQSGQVDREKVIGQIEGRRPDPEAAGQEAQGGGAVEQCLPPDRQHTPGWGKKRAGRRDPSQGESAGPAEDSV